MSRDLRLFVHAFFKGNEQLFIKNAEASMTVVNWCAEIEEEYNANYVKGKGMRFKISGGVKTASGFRCFDDKKVGDVLRTDEHVVVSDGKSAKALADTAGVVAPDFVPKVVKPKQARPPNAYSTWIGKKMKEYKLEHPAMVQAQIMKDCAALWKTAPENPKRTQLALTAPAPAAPAASAKKEKKRKKQEVAAPPAEAPPAAPEAGSSKKKKKKKAKKNKD